MLRLAAALRGKTSASLCASSAYTQLAHAGCSRLSEATFDPILGDSSLRWVCWLRQAAVDAALSDGGVLLAVNRLSPLGPRARGAQHPVRQLLGAVFTLVLLGLHQHVIARPRARGAQHMVRHGRGAVFTVVLLGLYQHVAARPCACQVPAE